MEVKGAVLYDVGNRKLKVLHCVMYEAEVKGAALCDAGNGS